MMYLTLGIISILITLVVVSFDILFVPTLLLTLFSLIAFISYLIYVLTRIDVMIFLYLILISTVVTVSYLVTIFKFKLWGLVSFKKNLSNENDYITKIENLIHRKGVTASKLRPGGKVRIQGKQYDAISKMGFIEQDKDIIVIGRLGGQLLVANSDNQK